MQLLATALQMQDFDRLAIRRLRIPGLTLMENAGRPFVDTLEKYSGGVSGKCIIVVCGKGNNGGDGYVIARHLVNRGAQVHVISLCNRREVKGDAKINLVIFLQMAVLGGSVSFDEGFTFEKPPRLPQPDIIVDAIFGTGFSGRVHGSAERAIRWINKKGRFVAAVDVASGIDATTGLVANFAVNANLTVTMGLAKVGHYVGSGRVHSGEVAVVDIGVPNFLFSSNRKPVYRVSGPDVAAALPRRPLTAHKHSVGKVFVLAGSRNFTGAPTMAAQAAMKSGAGTVILGVPKSIYGILVRKVTEVMVTPLEETPEGSVSEAAKSQIRERMEWADVVALGPGLSTNPETQRLIWDLLPQIEKPLIVDADGLNALAANITPLKKRRHPTILTPHVGELSRLTGKDSKDVELFRVEVARAAAKGLGCTVVLKGAPTVVGTTEGESFVNSTGNPGMATAGAGDVLTGMISGLLAQGMSPKEASFSGVFIHGMAGDLGARRFGQRALMALDILSHVPDALKLVELY